MTIRKALPFLWKYLAVVATSCLLAFVISNETRAQVLPPTLANGSIVSLSTMAEKQCCSVYIHYVVVMQGR